MKRWIAAVLMVITALGGCFTASASYSVPEAYMGFSVTEDWYVLSKNMEDEEMLEAMGITAEEVNETLVKSDCEYFIINPKEKSEIYVKVKKNAVSEEFYNIFETEDEILKAELDRILQDGFSVDQFHYLADDVIITPYAQMKFVTVPGTAQYDGKRSGMVLGFTFVNGSGIAFLMHTDTETPVESDIATVQSIADSVSFTVIKEKGEAQQTEEAKEEEKAPNPFGYIVGGLGAIALAALCLYLIKRIQKPDTNSENGE